MRRFVKRTRGYKKQTFTTTEEEESTVAERQSEQAIKIRKVTDIHSNWSSQGELENGKFSYKLILDNGAEEAIIMPTAQDAKLLRDFFSDAESVYWDMEREVLIFGKNPVAGGSQGGLGRGSNRGSGPFGVPAEKSHPPHIRSTRRAVESFRPGRHLLPPS